MTLTSETRAPVGAREDEDLRHLCRLASIAVSGVRDPGFIHWMTEEADEIELANQRTCLLILCDAFVELARRQGMLPTFRVPSLPANESQNEGAAV